ncbi:MAG: DUF5681 domain-containing protein [bacterium]
MPFKKGQSGNLAGRPKGKPNKQTQETRELITSIIEEHFSSEKLQDDLEKLEPRDRLNFLSKLLEFIVPKLTRGELSAEVENKPFDLKQALDKFFGNE